MPRKKGQKQKINSDFTINDCANAVKPVGRVKKSVAVEVAPEKTWEDLNDDEFDLVEETNSDGTQNFVYRKKRCHSKTEDFHIDDRPGVVFPEIVWYHISFYINPEDVGRFAGINKCTYAITKRESFWRSLYMKFCKNQLVLPEKLRIQNCYKLYGLRQRVIRSLYHTYSVFIKKVIPGTLPERSPHELVKRRCVNVWYYKGPTHWFVFFKLKKYSQHRTPIDQIDIVEELGRIDANPEEETQVLQVICQNFYEVPPLMGMTLSYAKVVLSKEFRHRRLHLGFHTGHYTSSNVVPECSVVIDTIANISVYDWWHPKYPHFDDTLPSFVRDEESLPVLKKDFFTSMNRKKI